MFSFSFSALPFHSSHAQNAPARIRNTKLSSSAYVQPQSSQAIGIVVVVFPAEAAGARADPAAAAVTAVPPLLLRAGGGVGGVVVVVFAPKARVRRRDVGAETGQDSSAYNKQRHTRTVLAHCCFLLPYSHNPFLCPPWQQQQAPGPHSLSSPLLSSLCSTPSFFFFFFGLPLLFFPGFCRPDRPPCLFLPPPSAGPKIQPTALF